MHWIIWRWMSGSEPWRWEGRRADSVLGTTWSSHPWDVCEFQPREGKNQVATGVPFILKEQRDTVGIPSEVVSMCWDQTQWPGEGWSTGVWLWLSGNSHSRWETKPWSLSASSPRPRARLPSCSQSEEWAPEEVVAMNVGLWRTLPASLRTGTTETFFPWATSVVCN